MFGSDLPYTDNFSGETLEVPASVDSIRFRTLASFLQDLPLSSRLIKRAIVAPCI